MTEDVVIDQVANEVVARAQQDAARRERDERASRAAEQRRHAARGRVVERDGTTLRIGHPYRHLMFRRISTWVGLTWVIGAIALAVATATPLVLIAVSPAIALWLRPLLRRPATLRVTPKGNVGVTGGWLGRTTSRPSGELWVEINDRGFWGWLGQATIHVRGRLNPVAHSIGLSRADLDAVEAFAKHNRIRCDRSELNYSVTVS